MSRLATRGPLAFAAFAAFAAMSTLSGCSLLSNAPPVEVRWFSPESVETVAPRTSAGPGTGKISLGRVTSSAILRNHIVFRRSNVEFGTYDDLEWTDYPETYVRHALVEVLSRANRLAEAPGPGVATLDVDVIGFEEVRRGPSRSGRVRMAYELRDGDTPLKTGVVTAERPAEATDIDRVVRAIASALEDATTQLADAARDPAAPAATATFATPTTR